VGYQYFKKYMCKQANYTVEIKKSLRIALENNEFFMCYQPIFDMKTGRIVSMEALVRWKHPQKGVISPLKFIPVAEETLLIIPIGEWILREVCKQTKIWHDMGFKGISISVNIEATQLEQPDFVDLIDNILSETGLESRYLELEITESTAIKSINILAKNLCEIKRKGIGIVIDDFGTGYCSLNYLQRFVVNALKIDRTFVYDAKSFVNRTIINSIISLGHKLGNIITAEGIETKEQLEFLRKIGCDRGQGYYLSKPLTNDKVQEFLKERIYSS